MKSGDVKFSKFDIKRLGQLFPSNLSFNRRLLQKAAEEKWAFRLVNDTLDKEGFGRYIIEVQTPTEVFSFIAFSQYLDPAERTDRVIAVAWDVVFALCLGKVDDVFCDELKENLVKQEGGRYSSRVLCISRANKSVRMFQKVVDALVAGKQPEVKDIVEIGYLYRTTAVYGNGKFGMADFDLLVANTSLNFPFAAQMLTVYLVREFSYFQVNHIAKNKDKSAVKLSDKSMRNIGIGNSTGLGMAPFLIKHSKPVAYWILARDNSINDILKHQEISEFHWNEFLTGLQQGIQFFKQSYSADIFQTKQNKQTEKELRKLYKTITLPDSNIQNWEEVIFLLRSFSTSFQTKEAVNSLLLELYPKTCDSFFVDLNHSENFQLIPQMTLLQLREIIHTHYSWIKSYDFNKSADNYFFWYYSENKEEPRLGVRNEDEGVENQMPIGIAKSVTQCFDLITIEMKNGMDNVAEFLIKYPKLRAIVKRIQYMGQDENISDIHINVFSKDVLPTDLLRCKLALLGAMKFDPKSDRWVKVTFFQGAPLSSELTKTNFGIKHLFPVIN